jgi:endonuclease IV
MLKLHGDYIIHNKISKKLVMSTSELLLTECLLIPLCTLLGLRQLTVHLGAHKK